MKFSNKQISNFTNCLDLQRLRLDADEKNHSLYLARKMLNDNLVGKEVLHVEQIHLHDDYCNLYFVPQEFRTKLYDLIKLYTTGFCSLQHDQWIPTSDPLKD
jgi:hypothetical protein